MGPSGSDPEVGLARAYSVMWIMVFARASWGRLAVRPSRR